MIPNASRFNLQAAGSKDPAGMGINARKNNDGHTALHLAVMAGDDAEALRLLKKGALATQPDKKGRTPLHAAVIRQDQRLVRMMLEAGAEMAYEDAKDQNAIFLAVETGAPRDFIDFLIENGAKPHLPNSKEKTLLHVAAAKDRTDLIPWLLTLISPDSLDQQHRSPLHEAVLHKAYGALRVLIEAGATPDFRDTDIKTPLYHAAEKGDVRAVDILLEDPRTALTLDLYRSHNGGYTPLQIAVQGGHFSIVQKLHALGASLDREDHWGRHSLYLAAEWGHVNIVRYLIEQGVKVTDAPKANTSNKPPMSHALHRDRIHELLALLCAAGMDIDDTDQNGNTALHEAVNMSHIQKAKAFLEKGAQVNRQNRAGKRPLDLAVEKFYQADIGLIEALLLFQADPGISSNDQVTFGPLHHAARMSSPEVMHLLLAHRVPVNEKDRSHHRATALHIILKRGLSALAQDLLGAGADPLIKDAYGRSALHLAGRSGMQDFLFKILEREDIRAEINLPDSLGRTPLLHACRKEKLLAATALLEAGADVTVTDNVGFTVLHHVIAANSKPLLSLLTQFLGERMPWNIRDNKNGNTPLHVAVSSGLQMMTCELLARPEVSLRAKNDTGQTPLHIVSLRGDAPMMENMLAEIKKRQMALDGLRDHDGQTALHLTTRNGSCLCLDLLLEAGMDPNAQTFDGSTSLHIAVQNKNFLMIERLLKYKADPHIKNKEAFSAVDLALMTGDANIISLFQKEGETEKKNVPPAPRP